MSASDARRLSFNCNELILASDMDDLWTPPLASSCPSEIAMVKSESSSCEFFTENDLKSIAKERQKKDNHNMSEYDFQFPLFEK